MNTTHRSNLFLSPLAAMLATLVLAACGSDAAQQPPPAPQAPQVSVAEVAAINPK